MSLSPKAWTIARSTHDRRSGELLFEGKRDPEEMARITCSYVLKLGAGHTRMVACGKYVWVRLQAADEITNLLFLRPGVTADASVPGSFLARTAV